MGTCKLVVRDFRCHERPLMMGASSGCPGRSRPLQMLQLETFASFVGVTARMALAGPASASVMLGCQCLS